MSFKEVPKSKAQLHIHLDGSVRPETVWDLAQKKGIKLPVNSLEELKKKIQVHSISLAMFLEAFAIITPAIQGDKEALRRISYEFCEDSAKEGVYYVEVRYSPQILAGDLCCVDVVQTVTEALKKGSEDFGITVNSILCCFWPRPDWSAEVVELCDRFRNDGVVGMDIAGNEPLDFTKTPIDPLHVKAFQEGKKRGLHITMHAGENGAWHNVKQAIELMGASRVGHGYHVLDDADTYQEAQKLNIHFEVCPTSSYVTNSVPKDPLLHPVIRFAKDGINFSINTDDPIITDTTLNDEYDLMMNKMKLSKHDILQANLNAVASAFIQDSKKKEITEYLVSLYKEKFGEDSFRTSF